MSHCRSSDNIHNSLVIVSISYILVNGSNFKAIIFRGKLSSTYTRVMLFKIEIKASS